jgi:hypothetical protein
MAIGKRGPRNHGGASVGSVDPSHKVRLVSSNQAKREANIRGELASVKPKVTLPKFSWDKKDD